MNKEPINSEESLVAETIITLATARGKFKTICPSEVARTLWPGDWRKHMPEVREAAFAIRDNGQIRIMQKGKAIAGKEITGPMRIQIV